MDTYLKRPLGEYVEDLYSGLPAPGGGSASALAGSLGVALLSMVVNFTVGKEKFKEVEEEFRGILKQLELLKNRLKELVQEDIETYGSITKAYKLPKETELEKTARTGAIQEACRMAAGVPLEVAQNCAKAMGFAGRILEAGNQNLKSDVGAGVLMLEAALEGAVINVDINLAAIKDGAFTASKKAQLVEAIKSVSGIKETIMEKMKF